MRGRCGSKDSNDKAIVTFDVTENPTSDWVIQRLTNAFPAEYATKYLIFDKGSVFNSDFKKIVEEFGIEPKQTAFRSPWQNGKAERWVMSIRTDILDHIIPVNSDHLYRVMKEYVDYYHQDRIHHGLAKDCPIARPSQQIRTGGRIIAYRPKWLCGEFPVSFHLSLRHVDKMTANFRFLDTTLFS